VRNATRPDAERFAAARLLARSSDHRDDGVTLLSRFITPGVSFDTQRDAIAVLGQSGGVSVTDVLLENWSTHAPQVRSLILEQIFRREPWVLALLERVQKGEIAPSDFDTARRDRLLRHGSKSVRVLASAVFKDVTKSSRQSVVEQYRPALKLEGDPARGALVFTRVCVTCHKYEDKGNEIGPDLRSVAEHPPEKILANILDPSADVQPGYHAYSATLQNSEELYGIIAAETANSMVMKLSDGSSRTILRKEITTLRSSNLSLMPDGLESGINLQEMADLIVFLKKR